MNSISWHFPLAEMFFKNDHWPTRKMLLVIGPITVLNQGLIIVSSLNCPAHVNGFTYKRYKIRNLWQYTEYCYPRFFLKFPLLHLTSLIPAQSTTKMQHPSLRGQHWGPFTQRRSRWSLFGRTLFDALTSRMIESTSREPGFASGLRDLHSQNASTLPSLPAASS